MATHIAPLGPVDGSGAGRGGRRRHEERHGVGLDEVDDVPGVGAVVDVDGRRSHPQLEVDHRQRNVLRVLLQQECTGCIAATARNQRFFATRSIEKL